MFLWKTGNIFQLQIQFHDTTFRSESFTDVIENLKKEFINTYANFIKMESDTPLFSSLFSFDVYKAPESLRLELTDIQCDDIMKGVFNPSNVLLFYKKYRMLKA